MQITKEERNKELILKRKKDPKKWTFRKLKDHYGFKSVGTVHELWERHEHKYQVENKKAVRV